MSGHVHHRRSFRGRARWFIQFCRGGIEGALRSCGKDNDRECSLVLFVVPNRKVSVSRRQNEGDCWHLPLNKHANS